MRAILRLLLILSLIFKVDGKAAEIHVFAAASLSDALKEAGVRYEKNTGEKVTFNFGASSFLARQVEAGAPADLFFSADETQMTRLEEKGLIVQATRRNRLSNALVIVVAADTSLKMNSPRDLVKPEIKRIGLADPDAVPAGVYAKAYLEKQNLWSAISAKVVPTENVRGALSAVESGNVEAAIVYKTDAAISRRVKIAFEVPRADAPQIHYPIAIVKESSRSAAAEKFLEYIFSPAATAIFQKYGFVTE